MLAMSVLGSLFVTIGCEVIGVDLFASLFWVKW